MIPTWIDGALQPYDKLSAHREGLRHKAVSVFVVAGDAVLLQQRAAHKYHTPGLWANACCTHPEWAEDSETCAVRRLQQELGITGLAPQHRGQVEYRADVGGGLIEHEVVEVFVADAPATLSVTPNPDEAMAIRWLQADQLEHEIAQHPDRFTPWLRIYLAEHHAMIFGDKVA
ncbi:isopentenyl-diphosphate delta-isomerase [Sulfitobacter sp. TSTF-M16]|uniref:Isopentenyl-diphosphate Delta-isomerase n=2 Tax=Sulfitobacter aestuariivivens TaxID=2766981 RepID=A0A927D4T5_9RHOB|nr:isopentenyl-diphosphate delta-isomerase [Sulfitobacter aestuariivivens]